MSATYTVKQVADLLGYSTNSIYTFLKEKRLKGVRLGRGRFRIPQSEVDRLLAPQGGQMVVRQVPQPSMPVKPEALIETPVVYEAPRVPYQVNAYVGTAAPNVEVPSLFDWFAAIASIVLGLAMFLFSRTYEEFSISQIMWFMPILRISFICGGFGILLTDVVGKRKSIWHTLFHLILTAVYGIFSYILLTTGSVEGVAVYGSLTVMLVAYSLLKLDGVAGFLYYVALLIFSLIGVAYMKPTHSSLLAVLGSLSAPGNTLGFLPLALTVVVGLMIWSNMTRRGNLFAFGMLCVSVIMASLSVHFAQQLQWGRALYLLLIAIMSFFVPVWQSLSFTHKRDRSFVFGAFGSILTLFIVAVGMVRVMQTNIISFAGSELKNKAQYGRFLLENSLAGVQTSLVATANNPLVAEALEKKKPETLMSLFKNVFESGSVIRQVVLLTSESDVATVYPMNASTGGPYATKDYVVRARSLNKIVVSETFESIGNNLKRKVIIVAVPVVGKDAQYKGLIIGITDMGALGYKLQQIVSSTIGEYILVADKYGKTVVHPDATYVGSDIEDLADIKPAYSTKQGAVIQANLLGTQALSAYEPTEVMGGWVVQVVNPVHSLLQITPTANITIFGVISLSLLIVIVFLLSHRIKHVVGTDTAVNSPVPTRELTQPMAQITVGRSTKKIRVARKKAKDSS